MHITIRKICLAVCLLSAGVVISLAQASPERRSVPKLNAPRVAQIVALDECDPATFNAALGPDFCHNVALGASTTLADLFAKAAAGTPDKHWDFEPDVVDVKKGGTVILTDQGGEPHTFTE